VTSQQLDEGRSMFGRRQTVISTNITHLSPAYGRPSLPASQVDQSNMDGLSIPASRYFH
jgi:hypothetical protein